jgi:phosphate-selective porin
MVHGRANAFGGPRLGYEAGVFRQGGEGAPLGPLTAAAPTPFRAVDQATVAGRLLVWPFDRPKDRAAASPSPLRSLRVGVAATSGLVPEGDNSLRGQDSFSKPFFPHFDVNGRRTRAGLEASWRGGPASVKAELIHVRDERRAQGLAGADLPALTSTGWYVQGAWTLVQGGRTPSPRGRWLGRGGIGDVEVAARLERIGFGSAAPAGEPPIASPRAANLAGAWDTAVTLGVNWQPLPLTRVQFNVVRDEVGGTAWTQRHLQPLVWGVVTRFQVAF